MRDILFSYWGCGKFFITMKIRIEIIIIIMEVRNYNGSRMETNAQNGIRIEGEILNGSVIELEWNQRPTCTCGMKFE